MKLLEDWEDDRGWEQLSYEDRLTYLGLFHFKNGRLRGDHSNVCEYLRCTLRFMCLLWQVCSSLEETELGNYTVQCRPKICLPKQWHLDELVNVYADKWAGNKGSLNKWVHEFSILFLLFFLNCFWKILIKEIFIEKVFSNQSIFSFNVNSIANQYIEYNLSPNVQGNLNLKNRKLLY